MKNLACFAQDEDYLNLIDIIARTYGTLPSEIVKLDWYELMLCVRCIKARSTRMNNVLKSQKKNSALVPNISLMDFIDLIG